MKLLIIAVLYLLTLSSPSYGKVPISTLSSGKFIGKSLQILRSPKKLNIDDVILSRDFKDTNQEVPRFGYTYDDIWAKLEIENNPNDQNEFSDEEIFFEFRGPIEIVRADLVQNNKVIQTEKAGMFLYPEDESFISGHSLPVVKFKIPHGISTIYFSETAVAPHFPIISYNRSQFDARIRENSSVINILIGISFAFLLILIILFIFVSGSSVIFLTASFVSFLALVGFVTGMFRSLYSCYGGSKAHFLAKYMQIYPYWPLFCSLYLIFLSLFAMSHLGKDHFFNTTRAKVFTTIALLSQALLGIVSLFDIVLAMNCFSVGFNITIVQSLYWSFHKYRAGKREEIFTITGWSIYGVFNSLQLFYFLGIADNTFFAIWGSIFGFFSILSLMTISLVERNRRDLYKVIADEKRALIKLEENFNELRKRDEIIQVFSSPKINLELSLGLNPLEFTPRYMDTAVLFFDMRGFTKLSESLDLKKVHDIINLYVGEIIKGVQDDGGYIDKIIGDAIMAQFEKSDDCLVAVKKIRSTLSELNRIRVSQNLPPVKFGTGISYGRVLSANFGSTVKMDRTIIGDIVNKASRIEAMTKTYCVDVLFDQEFYESLKSKEDIRFLGPAKLKGRDGDVNLFEYYGHNGSDIRQIKLKNSEKIMKAMEMGMNGKDFPSAISLIEDLIQSCPKHTFREGELMDQTLVTLRELLVENSQNIQRIRNAS